MNTHILVPIKEFKKHMKETKGYLEHAGLKYWWENGKQISLDEKDINTKAFSNSLFEAYSVHERDAFQKGYKQALKDLL